MTDEGGASFGPAMDGFIKYQIYTEAVKTKLQYFRDSIADDVLNIVLSTCRNRQITIQKGDLYWRAQLGCKKEFVTYRDGGFSWDQEEYFPYNQDRMKPISNWQSEGRANPRGIPYLYLASTRDAALAEIRPWNGSTISVAQFKIERDLNVIDCSKHHSKKMLRTLVRDKTCGPDDGIWIAIDRAFATPVSRDEEGGEYIPTQIIAELFKREGFHSIVYGSLLSETGLNLALFNLDDANVVSQATLYTAASISFDFQPYGNDDVDGSAP